MKKLSEVLVVALLTIVLGGYAVADGAISQDIDVSRSQSARAVEEMLEGQAKESGAEALDAPLGEASGYAGYHTNIEEPLPTARESLGGIWMNTKSLLSHVTRNMSRLVSWFLSRSPLWLLAFIVGGLVLRSLLTRYRQALAARRFARDIHLSRTSSPEQQKTPSN